MPLYRALPILPSGRSGMARSARDNCSLAGIIRQCIAGHRRSISGAFVFCFTVALKMPTRRPQAGKPTDMCGICGQYNFGDRAPVRYSNIVAMADSIAHRGPDDCGYFVSNELGLGFRRLSIIDLVGGHQPMTDGNQSVWVTFNGEIYNYLELKRELEEYGHVFRTKSDTEVIVHGYKQWGDDFVNHLNGMFGLAIWDVLRQRLVLARDAYGIKLIYYRIEKNRLYFGSEVRAVLATTDHRPEVDPNSLGLFLRYRYTPSPNTMFRGVKKLAAGSMLVCEKGSAHVKQWYQYRPTPFSPRKSGDEAAEELLELYKRAMKRHLLSDVPVGLLLSGGIDSG